MVHLLIHFIGGKSMGKIFVSAAIAALMFALLNSYIGIVAPSTTVNQ